MADKWEEILQALKEINSRLEGLDSRVDTFEERLGELEQKGDEQRVSLTSRALDLTEPENSEVLLCLDFGTARSKAFGTDGSDQVLVDIAVGRRAGTDSVHSLFSCIYIGDDQRIYFGDVAAAKSELAVSNGSRKRIDSFKSMITYAAPGTDLRASYCEEEVNPTSIWLSDGDVLTLYLAYLTDMAVLELAETHGLSRYVRRRFTTPVFDETHLDWASKTLRKHYAEAILVADHFSGRWHEGIDVAEANGALRAASKKSPEVEYLIDDPVVEPVAAFASRFRDYEPKEIRRELISIVDIGAGTTDFATFALIEQPGLGIKMFRVPGSIHVLRKAGNEVDRLLHEYILNEVKDSHSGLDEAMLGRIRADLSLRQRQLKENLFRHGWCQYALSDDTRGEVHLSEFLSTSPVKGFEEELKREFERSLTQMDASWITQYAQGRVVIVLTGGGARLPMAETLTADQVRVPAGVIDCVGGNPIPKWVSDDYPELVDEFSQLAVSIGGASRNLPSLADEVFASFKGLAEGGQWVIPPAYKGS